MNAPLEWIAWYTEGREFTSQAVAWKDLPPDGCLLVVSRYWEQGTRYRTFWHGDWVALHDGTFRVAPTHPVPGRWSSRPTGVCRRCAKRGAQVSDAEWAAVLDHARAVT